MSGTLVFDLLTILTAGLIAGLVCRWLSVSVLIGYLVVGTIIGKAAFGWVQDDQHQIEYIAEAGVFLLLFSIGLEFSLDELGRLGREIVIGGATQMLLVAAPVAALLLFTGQPWRPAILIAAAVSFSSTVLVFKALSEWGHANLPHGRRAIGILLFQDAALIPLLLLIPLLTDKGEAAGPLQYLYLGFTSVMFIAAVVALRQLLAHWMIPMFASYRSPDLVVLFTIVLLGGVTAGAYTVGLPPAIGAFAAGLVFSGNRWTKQIDALILPFRETFAAVFFVSLGLLFDVRVLLANPLLMLACFIGLLAVKFAAATVALGLAGWTSRTSNTGDSREAGLAGWTSFRWHSSAGMGLGLAHVGEFAFVLVLLGWEAGVITESDYQRIVALAIGSLILTPLLLKTGLRWTQSSGEDSETTSAIVHSMPAGSGAVVVGAGPIGRQAASWLETAGKDVCLVDLSPINLHPFAQQGIRTVAGDATERTVLERAGVDDASIIVLCVPSDDAALQIVRELRRSNPAARVLVRCRYRANVAALSKSGASQVVSEEAEASSAIIRELADMAGG